MKSAVVSVGAAAGTARSSDPAALVLEDFLPYRLSVLANTVSRSIARLYSERFDITIHEWRVLAVLGRFGPLAANQICNKTAMDKVQVSRAVSRLLKAGRLRREITVGDRRRAMLSFTADGEAIYHRIVPLALGRERRLLEAFEGGEVERIDQLLQKLQAAATAMAHDQSNN